MTLFQLLALAPMLLGSAMAQSSDNVRVWAAVAYINQGERTPTIGDLDTILTPEGAQQMSRQGEAFRNRYLFTNGASGNSSTTDEHAPIIGLSSGSIVNDQLAVVSQARSWVVGSATAFLQSLYPPTESEYNVLAGGSDLANNFALNSSARLDYPLNGYQYPNILTLSSRDKFSTAVQGTTECVAWIEQMNTNLTQRQDLIDFAEGTLPFYQNLFSTAPFAGTIPLSDANFWYAYDIYEFVKYMYNHNRTAHEELADGQQVISMLKRNAFVLERAMNSDPVADNTDPLNELYTIAGRTLADFVTNQLEIVAFGGEGESLTLMFGSFRPLLSFFSMAGITTREDVVSGPSSRFPEPGAAIVFELIDQNSNDSPTIPSPEDLSIRFYYRATTNEGEPFVQVSLFGSGLGGATIPFTAFVSQMRSRGVTPDQWCRVCNPNPTIASWCAISNMSSPSHGSSGGVSPALAGVIGALTTLAVVGILLSILFLLFGFRLHREKKADGAAGAGGFKGPEKMRSDTDLTVTKRGAAHERIGSWEMRDGVPSSGGAGIVTKDFSRHRSMMVDEDEDDISVVGRGPVKAHETV
ncbi:histidine phosphatase superfamily [Stachybotrys elegans]|uniref:Histidine phosphatase superfamily n=1 Tax=Stachybotrys elegans TaxID=80388 RepID=A0A8K0WTS4_9HYPO|nr:histidine phosphatase superfamily [Stachybotrys elegans]